MATQSQVSQVACHSRELTGKFWPLVHEWKVQSQRVHRDFRGSAHDSLVSETSNREKHLAKFSNFLAWSVLAGDFGDSLETYLSREKRMFCTVRIVLKSFLVFPRTLCDCSFSLLSETYPNTPCHPLRTPFLLHFFSKSSRKRYGFSLSHSVSLDLSISLLILWVDFSICVGLVFRCCVLSVFDLLRLLFYVILFSMPVLFFNICLTLCLGFVVLTYTHFI